MLRNDGLLRVGPRRRGVQLLPNGPGGGGYVGPLDLVPNAAAAYSVARKLRAAYTGPLVRIRRASDDAEQDFYATSTGALDTAAVATFIAATTGAIKTLYDQSGNGRDATQPTAGNQPAYVASAQNGKPGMRFTAASSMRLTSSTFTALAQPSTALAVAKFGNAALSEIIFTGNTGSQNAIYVLANPDLKPTTFAGSNGSFSVQDNSVYKIFTGVFNGASSVMGVNSTEETVNAGTQSMGQFIVGSNAAENGSFFNGDFSELLFWNALLTVAQRTVIRNNQNTFYALY